MAYSDKAALEAKERARAAIEMHNMESPKAIDPRKVIDRYTDHTNGQLDIKGLNDYSKMVEGRNKELGSVAHAVLSMGGMSLKDLAAAADAARGAVKVGAAQTEGPDGRSVPVGSGNNKTR